MANGKTSEETAHLIADIKAKLEDSVEVSVSNGLTPRFTIYYPGPEPKSGGWDLQRWCECVEMARQELNALTQIIGCKRAAFDRDRIYFYR